MTRPLGKARRKGESRPAPDPQRVVWAAPIQIQIDYWSKGHRMEDGVVTPRWMVWKISLLTRVPVDRLVSVEKKAEIADARMLTAWMLNLWFDPISLCEISRQMYLTRRSHSRVRHQIITVKNRIENGDIAKVDPWLDPSRRMPWLCYAWLIYSGTRETVLEATSYRGTVPSFPYDPISGDHE